MGGCAGAAQRELLAWMWTCGEDPPPPGSACLQQCGQGLIPGLNGLAELGFPCLAEPTQRLHRCEATSLCHARSNCSATETRVNPATEAHVFQVSGTMRHQGDRRKIWETCPNLCGGGKDSYLLFSSTISGVPGPAECLPCCTCYITLADASYTLRYDRYRAL